MKQRERAPCPTCGDRTECDACIEAMFIEIGRELDAREDLFGEDYDLSDVDPSGEDTRP